MSEADDFGYSQFFRRKSKTSITIPDDGSAAKSKDLLAPKEGGVGQTNIPWFPGDYEIKACQLYSAHKTGGGFIDLRNTFSALNIYEDMFSSALQMDITVIDGIGFEEWLPIIGEESIYLEIKTANLENMSKSADKILSAEEGPEASSGEKPPGPFVNSSNDGLLKLNFSIYKISDKKELDFQQGMVAYTLHGVSKEYIDNCKQKVQRSAINPLTKEPRKISNFVRSLYKDFFKWSPKKIFIEPTKNLTNLITPNLTPFKTFEFLASRSVSAGQHAVGSSFVFFETVTGYHFVSIVTLFAGGGMGYTEPADDPPGDSPNEGLYTFQESRSKESYTWWPKNMQNPETDPSGIQQRALETIAIDHYEFTSNFDVLENLTKGMYANKLLTHDIVRMKTDYVDFNYIGKSDQGSTQSFAETKDGPAGMVSVSPVAKDKKSFDDGFAHLDKGDLCTWQQHALGAPEAHINFYPTNLGHDSIPHFKNGIGTKQVKHGGKMGPLNIVPNRVEQWMQQRTAQQQQLNNIKVLIRAPGRSCRMVGDVIDIKLPTYDKSNRGSDKKYTASKEHKYLSGKYLITKLRHNFTKDKYTVEFEAIKDSFKEPLKGTVAGSSAIMDDGTIKMSEDGTRVIGGF